MADLDEEYARLKAQVEKIGESAPAHLVSPLKNLIMLSEMRDKTGKFLLAFGRCEAEVMGERQLIGSSLKTKAVGLSLW